MFHLCVFVFEEKLAYELRLSLVGSEMCMRDGYGMGVCGVGVSGADWGLTGH